MPKSDWNLINRKIKECKESSNPVECLIKLFNETDDGWVAYNIGQILEEQNKEEEALYYYKLVYEKLPLQKYKDMAKRKIESLTKEGITSVHRKDTIYIVSCTKRKIWDRDKDAPKYIPAKEAYIGETMRRWLSKGEASKYPWLIFSSKYGLIEPDHPIRDYDIHFIRDPGAISEETILRQILYQEYNGKKITDYNEVYFVGSEEYYRKLKLIFLRAGIQLKKYVLN